MSRPASGGRVSAGIRARMAYGESQNPIKSVLVAPLSQKQAKPDLGVVPAKTEPREWRLWFAARVSSAPIRRTSTGKPKRKPPALPPNINERRSMNWYVEQKLVAYWRLLAKITATDAAIPPLEQVLISAIVYRRAMGVADEDGDFSRLKPLVDGLRDAGVIRDDTRGYVRYGGVAEQRAGADGPGITLIVREV